MSYFCLQVNALNRRVQGLEEDLEKSEEKLLIASQKLDKVKSPPNPTSRDIWKKRGKIRKKTTFCNLPVLSRLPPLPTTLSV
jgi:hypothetical protein